MASLRIGLHRSNGWVSKLIKWQTRSEYSHASLILPDGTVLEAMQGKGVVKDRNIATVGEVVDIFEVLAFDSIKQKTQAFAEEQLGKPYDWTMVLRFVSRRGEDRKASGKWFCSELVFGSFLDSGLALLRDTQPWEVSPGLLSKSPYLIPVGTNKDPVTA